jgi:hypothetical protein
MIAVFPLKTGGLMFVGFDSQNTSHSFLHYSNGNLWVPELNHLKQFFNRISGAGRHCESIAAKS